MLLAAVLKREAVGNRLGNRLDGELLARVADLVDVSVAGGDADAEPIGIRLGEFRDVIGKVTLPEGGVALVKCAQNLGYRGFHGLGGG